MTFNQAQTEQLLRPVNPRRVQRNDKGMSHLAAYDVSAHLTRIFGFGGWRKEILTLDLVAEDAIKDPRRDRLGWYVTYRCSMRLHVGGWWNDDGATGSASNLPDRGDAHDFAMKNAISYALKRCAKDLGDQFGLSLYNKGSTDPLVIRTLDTAPGEGTVGQIEDDMPDLSPDWDEEPPGREDGRHMTAFGLSRTGVSDEELDANGEMTREQAREHSALAKGADGKLPARERAKVQRLTVVQPDDPFHNPGTLPEQRDYSSPGTATPAQVKRMQTLYSKAFPKHTRDERLINTALALGVTEVGSFGDLSHEQARIVIERLEQKVKP